MHHCVPELVWAGDSPILPVARAFILDTACACCQPTPRETTNSALPFHVHYPVITGRASIIRCPRSRLRSLAPMCLPPSTVGLSSLSKIAREQAAIQSHLGVGSHAAPSTVGLSSLHSQVAVHVLTVSTHAQRCAHMFTIKYFSCY